MYVSRVSSRSMNLYSCRKLEPSPILRTYSPVSLDTGRQLALTKGATSWRFLSGLPLGIIPPPLTNRGRVLPPLPALPRLVALFCNEGAAEFSLLVVLPPQPPPRRPSRLRSNICNRSIILMSRSGRSQGGSSCRCCACPDGGGTGLCCVIRGSDTR